MSSVHERRRLIIDTLAERGSAEVRPLAEALGVAQMTIRRDLDALQREGLLRRTHGGAVALERVAYEISFQEKQTRRQKQKARIGAACAELAQKGETVFLDSGSTTLEIARALRDVGPAAIITHNLCIVSEYLYQSDIRVLMPGGELNPLSPDLYGEWTYAALREVTIDVAFLGADAVDPAGGYFTPDLKSATISKIAAHHSRRAILAADSSKFGRQSQFKAGDLGSLTAVVTDRDLPAEIDARLESLGVKVILA